MRCAESVADSAGSVRMRRVALVIPAVWLREVLVEVAAAGVVQLDVPSGDGNDAGSGAGRAQEALRRLGAAVSSPAPGPVLAAAVPDLDRLARAGRAGLLAGEAELERYAADAVPHGELAALLGWCPVRELPGLTARLGRRGAAVVPLPAPRGVDPPTLLASGGVVRRSFAPLVSTYGTVAYPDVDPTLLAGIAYVVMFGMMFGDAGQGALLLVAAWLTRIGRPRWLARLRAGWPFVAGAGMASIVFGALYGEFFGPTGVLPVLWLAPLEQPVRLLASAVGIGAVLLAAAYLVAIVSRWREGGARLAVYASSGVAGAAVFLGLGLLAGGLYLGLGWLSVSGAAVALLGLLLAGMGFLAGADAEAPAEGRVGAAGVLQAAVEVFDALLRLGSNVVSFARLAAFGLTHAALAGLVWRATAGLAGRGWWGLAGAVVVFCVGNALTFTLEGLIAAVQALRLEFYELFSRVFAGEGQPFRPWRLPVSGQEAVNVEEPR